MSTHDATAEPGRTKPGSKPYRSGIARTLGRRAMPSRVPPASGEVQQPSPPLQSFPVAPQQPAVSSGESATVRRSQTQMAAIFARAVAQGQRNL